MLKRLMHISAGLALAAALSSTASAEVTLHRGNGGEPQTLDQAHTSIDVEANVLKDLYEGLTVYDASGNVTPGVAESWTVSDDGLVYTFKLRDDAKWSNGDPVTADDFIFSYQRVEDPKEAAAYASILYPIKNAEKINTATPDAPVALDELGMKAIDPKTLEITLERPTPYFLQLMTHQTALPVNKAAVEKYGADFVKPGNMVSDGAYVLSENVANDHITLVKNANYYGAAKVKIDTVIFYPTEDQAAAIRRFQAGELDLHVPVPGRPDRVPEEDARRRRGAHRAEPRHLLLRLRHAACAVRRRARSPRPVHGDRPRFSRQQDLCRRPASLLQLRTARHGRLHSGASGFREHVAA